MLSLMLHYPSKLIDAHQKPLQGLCNGLTVASHWNISRYLFAVLHLSPVSLQWRVFIMQNFRGVWKSRSFAFPNLLTVPWHTVCRMWGLKGPKTAKFKRWNRRVEVQALNPKLWNLSFGAQILNPKRWNPNVEIQTMKCWSPKQKPFDEDVCRDRSFHLLIHSFTHTVYSVTQTLSNSGLVSIQWNSMEFKGKCVQYSN